jgi:hypothetical protein
VKKLFNGQYNHPQNSDGALGRKGTGIFWEQVIKHSSCACKLEGWCSCLHCGSKSDLHVPD